MLRTAGARIARITAGRSALRPALVAVLLSTAMVSAPFLTGAAAQTYSFGQVTVEGNQRVDTASVLNYAGITRGESLTAGQLNDAYQRIVNAGLFETVELVPQGNTLLIRVTEFPTLSVVDFQGNRRIKDDELAELIQSRSRLVYSPSIAQADAELIAEAYRARGRLGATVDPRIIRRSDNRVDLVFEIREGKVVEVERLSIIGNRAFSDRRLRQVLATKQAGILRQVVKADTLVAERLEFDKQLLRDFYLSRGYVDVQVLDATSELTRERDASFVNVTVREGRQFRIGKISTVSELADVSAEEFAAVQRMRSGVVYSPSIIENNITRMENLAVRKGLNFLRIEPRLTRNERESTLDVEYVLSRGPKIFVERIDIEGNTTTLDQVIRRQFRSVEGDPFNPREIRQAAERIRALGFFKEANVESEAGSASDQVVVKVGVEEQPTGSLTIGATYGVSTGLGLILGFSETNFLGRGQSLSVDLTAATDSQDSSFSFREPAFLGRDLGFGLSGYYRATQRASSEYSTSGYGFGPSLDFPISQYGRLSVRYRFTQASVDNVDFGANPPPGVPPDNGSSLVLQEESLRGSQYGSAVGYTYSYDNRLIGNNPNGGFLLRFSQDFSGLGGSVNTVASNVFALTETKVLNEEVTLRAIVEGGYVASFGGYDTRVTDRYFGNFKLRGFERNGQGPRDLGATNQDALGGNAFAVARFEAEFPLGLPVEYGITGGAFWDVGSVWDLDNTQGTGGPVDDSLHIRSSIGVSVFWTTPIGPLRFNFSKAIVKEDYDEEQSFELTISTKF